MDALGVVDPDDFTDDEFEAYQAGEHDVPCTHCRGTGKVLASAPAPIIRTGSDGQNVHYEDDDDASEHLLRMAEGWC